MTLPFTCVFLALLLCYAPKLPLMLASAPGDASRKAQKRKPADGWRTRTLEAQRSTQESFTPFAIGVVIAHLAGVDAYRAGLLAMTFVVARVLYIGAHIAKLDHLRAVIWGVGLTSTALFYLLAWLQ